MAKQLIRRRQIAAKAEVTEGTAVALAAADADLLVYEPTVDLDIPMFKRDPSRSTLSNLEDISGMRSAKMTFKLELKGSGVKDTPPSWGKLLLACGFAETINAGTNVEYDPASTAIDTLTMALFADGVITKIRGARGTVKLTHKVGEPVMMEFEFTGVLDSVTDGVMLTGVTYEATIPQKFQDASLTIGSYAAILSALELDMANAIALREDANSVDGILSALITSREPKGSFDPEMDLIANEDFIGKWTGNTTSTFTETIGSVAGNKLVITAPKLQYMEVSDGDRNGIALAQTNFGLKMSSGDDEIKISHE